MERTAHFIHLPWTEFQVSRDQHALTFISAAVKGSTTTKGSEQGSITRSHSRQTKALFLWLSNCSHHSGSSSTFNEMNAGVSLLHPHTINSEHLSHPICHSLWLEHAHPPTAACCYSERSSNALWNTGWTRSSRLPKMPKECHRLWHQSLPWREKQFLYLPLS